MLSATVSYVNVTEFFTEIQAALKYAPSKTALFLRSRNCFWFLGHVPQVHQAVLLGNDDAYVAMGQNPGTPVVLIKIAGIYGCSSH